MEKLTAYGLKGKRAYYEGRFAALKSERASFDGHWKELSEYFMPRRARFTITDRNKGDRRNGKIIDSTGRYAARTLQSGMHAGLTSPARPWFKLGTPDPELAKFGPVRLWLHEVTQRMQTVFAGSNLYNALPTMYGDMGVFGTAAMAVLQDPDDLLRAYTYPVGSYVLGLDQRGLATTFMREYELTVGQVVETFGGPGGQPLERGDAITRTAFSRYVLDQWDRGNYEAPVSLLWVVCPNRERDDTKARAKYFPWTSCHFERGGEGDDAAKILRESGFRTFPVMAPRWDVTADDSYGNSSPGIDTLGDVKQLQAMQKEKGKAIEKMVDPPLTGPSALRTQKTSLLAGDVTYVDVRDGMQGLRPIHEVKIDISGLLEDMQAVQFRVNRGFYADLFLMLAERDDKRGGDMTAREIEERHEEKLLMLGPVLERTNDELLNPLIDRAFDMMDAAGFIPPAPQELHGLRLKVEYISLLAQAQKMGGVLIQDRFINTTAVLAQTWPEVRHKIDPFRVIDNYADLLGPDPNLVVEDDKAQEGVDADAKAAAAQQQAEVAKTTAGAAKDASAATLDNDSVLSRLAAQVAVGQ